MLFPGSILMRVAYSLKVFDVQQGLISFYVLSSPRAVSSLLQLCHFYTLVSLNLPPCVIASH